MTDSSRSGRRKPATNWIATAWRDHLPLITSDAIVASYEVKTIW